MKDFKVILERSFNLSESNIKQFLLASLTDIENIGEEQLFQQVTPFGTNDIPFDVPATLDEILENIKESYKQFLDEEDHDKVSMSYEKDIEAIVMTMEKSTALKLYKNTLASLEAEELSTEIVNSSEEAVASMEVKWRIVSAI